MLYLGDTMFCPTCKSLLIPKKVDKETVMGCSCGYTSKGGSLSVGKEKTKYDPSTSISVVDPEKMETLPLIDADCPKCGHGKAVYWLIQTRASDEPETKFMRCEKCKHTWRDYS